MLIDQMNRAVNVPSHPQRIISLVPSQTELLFDLGLDKQVVGITKFCVHPRDKFQSKIKIGGTKQFRFEVIEALAPDLIIGNKEENYQSGIEALAQKYPVWMSDIVSLADALQMIAQIGNLTNTESKSQLIVDEVVSRFADFTTRQRKVEQTVAYFIWYEPLMVVGGNTFINTMLGQFGLNNVFESLGRYPQITPEILQAAQPDWIFLSSEPFPFKSRHVAELRAISPQSKVKLVDGELFSWYGTRLLKAVDYFEELAEEMRMI
ncbi:MAG: helical backbone metal receptor [Microscillaceae bacterium]|jgi:ABC-type Fe3+-hydroxamate transport system substrate-binding protein|nr:helical backbone metal receptor [Microscillaceae bacterium]